MKNGRFKIYSIERKGKGKSNFRLIFTIFDRLQEIYAISNMAMVVLTSIYGANHPKRTSKIRPTKFSSIIIQIIRIPFPHTMFTAATMVKSTSAVCTLLSLVEPPISFVVHCPNSYLKGQS